MLAALWTFTPALAQAPLAIPADPPPVVIKPLETQGLGVSAATMAEFDDRRLRIHPAQGHSWRLLGAVPDTLDFAAGVNAAAVDLAPRLVVARGERLLAVPTLMESLGDNPALLRERIERKQWTANAWTAVSALGLVGAAVAYRLPSEERRPWLISSASMLVGGLVFGGNAQRRANRLARDLDLEYDRRELVKRVRAHNDALANELGIDPEAARDRE
ncbi:MAG: hypothetical protein AAGA48_34230 [Myxococcota bacterium]